jgi:hypothetical protein
MIAIERRPLRPPLAPKSEATVIAVDMELKKSAAITPKSLHEALGGRGSRSTGFTTWKNYVAARGRPAAPPVPLATGGYSSTINGPKAEVLRIIVAITTEVRREAAEVIRRRRPWRSLESVEFATLGRLVQHPPPPRADRAHPASRGRRECPIFCV